MSIKSTIKAYIHQQNTGKEDQDIYQNKNLQNSDYTSLIYGNESWIPIQFQAPENGIRKKDLKTELNKYKNRRINTNRID